MTEPKEELNMRQIKLFVYQRGIMFTNSKITMKFR